MSDIHHLSLQTPYHIIYKGCNNFDLFQNSNKELLKNRNSAYTRNYYTNTPYLSPALTHATTETYFLVATYAFSVALAQLISTSPVFVCFALFSCSCVSAMLAVLSFATCAVWSKKKATDTPIKRTLSKTIEIVFIKMYRDSIQHNEEELGDK